MRTPALYATELRDLRCALGLNQRQFAEQIGVDRDTVNNYENGRRSVPEPVIRLARRLAAEQGAPVVRTARKPDLRALRESKRLTPEQLAQLVSMPERVLRQLEAGISPVQALDDQVRWRLGAALGITL